VGVVADGPDAKARAAAPKALEVKSGHKVANVSGLAALMQQFEEAKALVTGTEMPLDGWLQSGPGKDLPSLPTKASLLRCSGRTKHRLRPKHKTLSFSRDFLINLYCLALR
jgi:hypothetical protein